MGLKREEVCCSLAIDPSYVPLANPARIRECYDDVLTDSSMRIQCVSELNGFCNLFYALGRTQRFALQCTLKYTLKCTLNALVHAASTLVAEAQH